MKNLKTIVLGLLLAAVSMTQAFAQNTPEQRQQAREELTKVYNTFATMDERDYHRAMDSLIDVAHDQGMFEEAELFEQLKNDPASRSEVLDMIQEKIEMSSENGIYFVIYMMYPSGWCYVGDITCGFGVAFLSILTMDGNPAAQY